ncbi:hypothetical protein C8Q76DRAFT_382831 [Earliella scabrosa]|nr:hypothetical protein C8Q76DRAFT_382831 [Earliella scabrosa]
MLFTTVDLPQNLNATHIHYVHTHLEFNSWHLDSLESRYDRLSNLLIDVVVETASVGVFTAIVATAAYAVIRSSNSRRNAFATLLLTTLLVDWTSSVATWVIKLSRARQDYAMLVYATKLLRIDNNEAFACVESLQCAYRTPSPTLGLEPAYTMHVCIGTAALVARAIITEALVCWYAAKLTTNKLARAILAALFVGASISGTRHAMDKCRPEREITVDGIPGRVVRKWTVVANVFLDTTTANILQVTNIFRVCVLLYFLWDIRDALKSFFTDSPEHEGFNFRRSFKTVVVPLGMATMLQSLCRSHFVQNRILINAYVYAFVSATNGFFVPLLCMYPSLALLRYHLNQIESKDATATDETANTGHPQASDEYNTETKTDPAAKQSGTTQTIDPKLHDDLIEP